jgi:hypothetical protein
MHFSSLVRLAAAGAAMACAASLLPASSGPASAAGEVIFVSPYDTSFVAKVIEVTTAVEPAVSFSNQYAGNRQVDPLVSPGAHHSAHDHAWLGTRLQADADINRLFDEPLDWAAGSNAATRGVGFAAEVIKNGRRSGYTPGVWWPVIWDAPPGKTPMPVAYRDGIPTYYLAGGTHGDAYLKAYPNGLGFLVDKHTFTLKNQGTGEFQVNFFGPEWWDGRNLTSADHRSHMSYERTARHTVPVPEFQTYVAGYLAYPDDPTPLDQRLKFGNPGAFAAPHLDYVAGFREPWFMQWLLDLGPNWGHPNNALRACGVQMPDQLSRRKLNGVRLVDAEAAKTGSRMCATPGPSLGIPIDAGYWLAERDGDIHQFGAALNLGDIPMPGGVTAVAIASRPQGDGFWVLSSDGELHARGRATDFGRVNVAQLTKPGERVSAMSAMPDGAGVLVFTTAGRIISFGSAPMAADLAGAATVLGLNLHGPIVGSVATRSGKGVLMVAADGGVFAVGDARFAGSLRGELTRILGPPGLPAYPVVGIVADPDGAGYWMVGRDGGVFAFQAPFRGSLPAIVPFHLLAAPVGAMVPYGRGYLLIGADGGVFNFSDRPFEGSAFGQANTEVVGIATARL